MHIAIDIRHLATKNPSGIGFYTTYLIKQMARQNPNNQFTLFATGSKKNLSFLPNFKQKNITIIKKNIPNKILNLISIITSKPLEAYLDNKPDIWWFPNLNIFNTKIPFALTVHDISFNIFPEFFTYKSLAWHKLSQLKKGIRDADLIISVSKCSESDLMRAFLIEKKKILITHLGVETQYSKKETPSDKTFLRDLKIPKNYILTLATLEPRKNIESIIIAYEILVKEEPKIPDLVIAGGTGWKSKKLIRLYKKSAYKNRIHLIGYIKEKHKPALYRNSKLFIFPSFYEGFGLPPLEAMASGVPVISSFTGSLTEVIGKASIMIDPYNISDLVSAMKLILNDQNLHQDLSKRGLIRSKEFTWEKVAKKTMLGLKSISKDKPILK